GAAQSVLARPALPRMVSDRNLSDPGTRPGCVDGDETVHLAVESNVPQYLAPVALQRATIVVQADAADTGNEHVGQLRRKSSSQPRVLPIAAPAAHDIKSF